jgi:putative flippase GtrA
VLARLARFHAGAGIVSLGGNVAITVAAVEWLHLPVLVANTVAVAVLGALNFLIADRYVFERVRGQVASERGTACAVNGTLLPAPVARRPVQDPAAGVRTLFRRRRRAP